MEWHKLSELLPRTEPDNDEVSVDVLMRVNKGLPASGYFNYTLKIFIPYAMSSSGEYVMTLEDVPMDDILGNGLWEWAYIHDKTESIKQVCDIPVDIS